MGLLLGYDLGSSFVKASVLDTETGHLVASAQAPSSEMSIRADHPGWAEQDPQNWWKHIVTVTRTIAKGLKDGLCGVQAIGISYQMHGLVLVDKDKNVLRPSIIWCDGRAVGIGNKAAQDLGYQTCFEEFLNLPGNFTASKLKWVKDQEPLIFSKVHKMMLPGDFLAMRLTGECFITESGLSEGILWDFKENKPASKLLQYYGLSPDVLPQAVPCFGFQGAVTPQAADELGIPSGTPVTYRSGDQPNNALSVNVLQPGETAVTAGTSGVVYGVTDHEVYDTRSRANVFLHVNHSAVQPRLGVLACVNGSGICNSWFRRYFGGAQSNGPLTYECMDNLAATVAPGSDGLFVIPYGNGPERTMENIDPGASIHGLRFNLHSLEHCARAVQEGVAFALNYGAEIISSMGCDISEFRAGHTNMFKSRVFIEAFSSVAGRCVELYETDGAQGAARGAGIGSGIYKSTNEAFATCKPLQVFDPDKELSLRYRDIYQQWKKIVTQYTGGTDE